MKYIAALFTLFIIGVVILADLDAIPSSVRALYDFQYGDKLGHFILYGLLNFLLTLTFIRPLPNRTSNRVALSVGLVLALAVGVEELSQRYFSARTFDLIDLSASYLGLLVGGWAALKTKNKR